MNDRDRLAALEARVEELEVRVSARVDAVLLAITAAQGVTIDALALIAIRDRALVENLLRLRRLSHQASGSGDVSAEMLKRYEIALDIAGQLTSTEPLGPR